MGFLISVRVWGGWVVLGGPRLGCKGSNPTVQTPLHIFEPDPIKLWKSSAHMTRSSCPPPDLAHPYPECSVVPHNNVDLYLGSSA